MPKTAALVAVVGLMVGALAAFQPHEVDVEYTDDARGAFTWKQRRAVQAVADAAFRDARRALPGLPERLTLAVNLGTSVIPETGENATVVPPAEVAWMIDPSRDVAFAHSSVSRSSTSCTISHEPRMLRRGH